MLVKNDAIYGNRRIRVCTWNATPAMISAEMRQFETELKRLGGIDLITLSALDDPKFIPCDLLVIAARNIDEDNFIDWIKGVALRLQNSGNIKTPAIIQANVSQNTQRGLLRWAIESNWYFDIVGSDHISSLPIRVANFLRLHDHLQEVNRMQKAVNELTDRVQQLESELSGILGNSGQKA